MYRENIALLFYSTHLNSISSTIYFLDIVESGLLFINLWNKSECCEIRLGCDLLMKKKKFLLRLHQLRSADPESVDTQAAAASQSDWAKGLGASEQLSESFVYRSASKQGGKDRGELKHETSAAASPGWGKFSRSLGIFTQTLWGRRINNGGMLSAVSCSVSWPAAARTRQWARVTRGVSRVSGVTLCVEWFIAHVNCAGYTDAARVAAGAKKMQLFVSRLQTATDRVCCLSLCRYKWISHNYCKASVHHDFPMCGGEKNVTYTCIWWLITK